MTASSLLPLVASVLLGPVEEARFRELQAAVTSGDAGRIRKTCDLVWRYHDRRRLLRVLLDHLGDCRSPVQGAVIDGLLPFGPEARPATPILTAIAADPKSKNRSDAVICLGWIGPGAAEAVGTLKGCLKDENIGLRYDACVSLWRIERRVDTVAPVLNAGLASRVPVEQDEAMCALACIGDGVKEAVWPSLMIPRGSPFPDTREKAHRLVPKFAPDKATAAKLLVESLLRNGEEEDRIGKLKDDGKYTLEEFADVYNFVRNERLAIIDSLVSLRGDAVPELIKLYQPRYDTGTRRLALEITAALGKHGKSAAAEVRNLTADPDPCIRAYAERALKSITTD